MNFEPEKFFIGLIDFFSILLPGALLTYVLQFDVGPHLLPDYSSMAETKGALIFLFSSYLLGHFIFLIGSWRLDNWYDAIRNATRTGQVKRLDEGKKLSSEFNRRLATRLFKKDVDNTVNQAMRIKNYYLDPLTASSSINTFQWCKAKLTLEYPEAIATVHRFEADSKFFRSLVVVLYILILWFGLVKNRPLVTLACYPMIILAFWRYVDQRLKATNQAYWYVITLEGQKENGFRQMPKDGLSHAGGVVYRRHDKEVQYLLVQAAKEPKDWVLPKGHILPGEKMQETAIREVREETGVWAQISSELGDKSFTVKGKSIGIQFYLMEKVEERKWDESREHAWLTYDYAKELAFYKETKDLLELADKKRKSLEGNEQKWKKDWLRWILLSTMKFFKGDI